MGQSDDGPKPPTTAEGAHLDLSAVETATKLEHGHALLQLVVVGSQLGQGEAQLGRTVDEVVDQPLPQRVLPRETEGLLKFVLYPCCTVRSPGFCFMALAAIVPY